MPWPREHRARTRERIVRSAAAAFRARGVDGVSVGEVMEGAGLTHGGFYAHFASKDALLQAALGQAARETEAALLHQALASADDAGRLAAIAEAYLSPQHVAHPERGCPVAALAPEIARSGGGAHAELARGIRSRIEWMRGLAPRQARGGRAAERAIGTLACMVGGVVLARGVGPEGSAALLKACRAFLRRALKPPPESRGRRTAGPRS